MVSETRIDISVSVKLGGYVLLFSLPAFLQASGGDFGDLLRFMSRGAVVENWIRPIVCGLLVKVLITLVKSWHLQF